MAESKISPHNLNDLKNTTDDALGNYLRGLSFQQDNSKLDVRLALGYVSVIIAGVIFYADWKLGWEATKGWTAVAVAAYAVLNGGFTYWMWAVEKGLVFEGSKNGKKIVILSSQKKHDPTYYLDVTTTAGPGATASSWQIRAPYTTWFTADGVFVAKPFQKWLASTITAVGDEDLKNASRDERDTLASPGVPVKSGDEAGASATGVQSEKATKRAKKT